MEMVWAILIGRCHDMLQATGYLVEERVHEDEFGQALQGKVPLLQYLLILKAVVAFAQALGYVMLHCGASLRSFEDYVASLRQIAAERFVCMRVFSHHSLAYRRRSGTDLHTDSLLNEFFDSLALGW